MIPRRSSCTSGVRTTTLPFSRTRHYHPPIGQVPGVVAAVTGNIQSNIQALAGAGAKTILVPNIPDLASTPSYRGTPSAGVAGALSAQHAAALNAQLGGLAKQLNVNIYVVDFATGFQNVLANPEVCSVSRTSPMPA